MFHACDLVVSLFNVATFMDVQTKKADKGRLPMEKKELTLNIRKKTR